MTRKPKTPEQRRLAAKQRRLAAPRQRLDAMRMIRKQTAFVAAHHDEHIERMTTDAEDWRVVDPVDAVEFAEVVHAVNVKRKLAGRPRIALPPPVEWQVLMAARRGMRKEQGKYGHGRDHVALRLIKGAITDIAKHRTEELLAEDKTMTLESARGDAALEAEEFALELGIEFEVEAILEWMNRDLLADLPSRE
jgi:hypothetical protein